MIGKIYELVADDWFPVREFNENNELVREYMGKKPVMIWDVLDWIDQNIKLNQFAIEMQKALKRWENKREPIDEQPLECIKYVYDLLDIKEDCPSCGWGVDFECMTCWE